MQGEKLPSSRQYVFAALITAVGRCLTWQNGSQAVRVVKAAREAGLNRILALAMPNMAFQV
jgi:hypothetical protein